MLHGNAAFLDLSAHRQREKSSAGTTGQRLQKKTTRVRVFAPSFRLRIRRTNADAEARDMHDDPSEHRNRCGGFTASRTRSRQLEDLDHFIRTGISRSAAP